MRPVEELYGDILHLLLVDHSKMHPVVDVILAQGMRAPVRGRHGWMEAFAARSLARWLARWLAGWLLTAGWGEGSSASAAGSSSDPQHESGEGEEEEEKVLLF